MFGLIEIDLGDVDYCWLVIVELGIDIVVGGVGFVGYVVVFECGVGFVVSILLNYVM